MGWTLSEVRNYVQRVEKTLSSVKEKKLKGLAFAKLFKEVKELSTAQRYVNEYISVNARDFRAYSFLGQLLEESQDWQGALKAYKKSLEINGNQKDVLLKVVELYSKIPVDPGRAKVWADKASKACPGHAAVFNLRWHLLVSAPVTDYEEMEDVLTEELSRRPREASLHIKLLKLYEGMGNLEQACFHCQKIERFRIFDKDVDWLTCVTDVTERYYNEKIKEGDRSTGFTVLLTCFAALCKLLELHLKVSTVRMATDILTRLDGALYNFQHGDLQLSEKIQSEVDVMYTEVKAQLYLHCATLVTKMAVEHRLTWGKAREMACAFLMASNQIPEPEPVTAWNAKRSPQKRTKPSVWFTMACSRLSQTGHLLLQLYKEKGIDWIKKCVANICTRQGQMAVLSIIYSMGIPDKSYLGEDGFFMDMEIKIPVPDELVTYDSYVIQGNTLDLQLICWLGLHWYSLKQNVRPGVGTLVSRLFNDISHDVNDLDNCQASTLCHRDIETFVYAVLRSSADRILESRDQPFEEGEPRLLPFPLSQSLTTKQQSDWWNAAYGLYIGRVGTMSASKQRNIVQCGLEVIRGFKNHGIDPRILLYIANTFLGKADEFCSYRERDWDYQVHIESLQKRGFYYLKLALSLFEARSRNITLAGPQNPLIPNLSKPLLESECQKYAMDVKIRLGRAAVEGKDFSVALRYLNEVETPLAAYEEAWIYRGMASQYDLDDIEGLRDHLFYLRKARERYEVCLRRYGNVKSESKKIVLEELEEVRFAVQSGQGLNYSQEKRLDLMDPSEDTEECPEETIDADITIEEKEREIDHLSAENSTLQNRVSFLEATLNAVQAEVEMLRMRRGRDDSASSSDNGKPRSLTEESNNFMQAGLREENSASGRATPKLETEMSWDSFSPAPLIDKGYFAGLASKVEKIEEEDGDKKDKKSESDETKKHSESFDDGIRFEPLVHLTKKPHSTGEEDEKVAFANRAKLYRFDSDVSQWKERGIGELKILVDPKTNVARILMRRDQVLRICANHAITPEMKLEAKEGSKATWIWCTFADISEGEPKSEKLAVRFKTVEIANDFKDNFIKSQADYKIAVDAADQGTRKQGNDKDTDPCRVEGLKPETWHCSQCQSVNPMSNSSCHSCGATPGTAVKPKVSEHAQSFEIFAQRKPSVGRQASLSDPQSSSIVSGESKTQDVKPTFQFNCSLGDELTSPPKSTSSNFCAPQFKPCITDTLEVKSRSASERSLSERAGMEGKLQTVSQSPNVFPSASEQSLRPTSSASATFYDFFNSQVTKSASHPWFPSGFGTARDPGNMTTLSTDSLAARGFPVLGTSSASTSSTNFPIVSSLLSSSLGQGARLPLVAEQGRYMSGSDSTFHSNYSNVNYNESEQAPENRSDGRFNFFGVASTRPLFGDRTEPREIDEEEFFRQNWDVEEGEYYDEEEEEDDYYDDGLYYRNTMYHHDNKYEGAEKDQSEDDDEEYDEFVEYDARSRELFGDAVTPKMDSDDDYTDAAQEFENLISKDAEGSEEVPCVVQMVDDDVFVTLARKTSRAQRAKAARFLLPSSFYDQEAAKPCNGCFGCTGQRSKTKLIPTAKPETGNVLPSINPSNTVQMQHASNTFGSKSVPLSFSDIASKHPIPFASRDESHQFRGAGSALFSTDADDNDDGPRFEPLVHLEKLPEIKSGEEGENTLFESRAKLYRFDAEAKQWKERGVGIMKILENSLSGYSRVLMRRDKILKICANHFIVPGMQLNQHGKSSNAWLWATHADYADGEAKSEKLSVKFKSESIATEFYNAFISCQQNAETGAGSREADKCAAEKTMKGTQHEMPPESAIDVSIQNKDKEGTTAIEDKADFMRQKFAPPSGSWECDTCLIRNNADKTVCVACQACKPGTQPAQNATTNSAPLKFGTANADPSVPLVKFGTASLPMFNFGTASLPMFNFGTQSQVNSQAQLAQSESQGIGQPATFTFSTSPVKDTSSQKEYSSRAEVASTSSVEDIRRQLAPKPGSWECGTCLLMNKANDSVCPACKSLKPGTEPCESQPQATPLFTFGIPKSDAGGGFSFGQSRLLDLNLSSSLIESNAESSATTNVGLSSGHEKRNGQNTSTTSENSIRQLFAPKPGSWECETCLLRHNADMLICPACQTPKPGESSSEKTSGTEPSFKFGISNQTGDGEVSSTPIFRFGTSDAAQTKEETAPLFSFGTSEDQASKFTFGLPASSENQGATPQNSLLSGSLASSASPIPTAEKWQFTSPTATSLVATDSSEKAVPPITSNLTSFWSTLSPSAATFFTPPTQLTSVRQPETPYFTPPSCSSSISNSNAPSATSTFSFTPSHGKSLFSLGSSTSQELRTVTSEIKTDHVNQVPDKVEQRTSDKSQFNASSALLNLFGSSGRFAFEMGSPLPELNTGEKAVVSKVEQVVPPNQTPQPSPVKVTGDEEDFEPRFSPQVSVERVVCKTGEECEKLVFSERAKLYVYDPSGPQWKERGIGDLKMLQTPDTNQSRLIMRRDQVLKLCANHLLVSGMTLTPMGDHGKAFVWKAFGDASDEDTKEVTLSVKFREREIANNFKDVFEKGVAGIAMESIGTVTPKVRRSRHISGSEEVDRCFSTKILDSSTVSSGANGSFTIYDEEVKPSNGESKVKSKSIASSEDRTQDLVTRSPEVQIIGALDPSKDEIRQASRLLLPQNWFSNTVVEKDSPVLETTPQKGSPSIYRSSKVSESEDHPEKEDHKIQFSPIVSLEKKTMTSGEENESSFFSARAKLYRFDGQNKQWKERGVGELKILHNSETRRYRLIMRRDQIKKLCANHYIFEGMNIERLQSSKHSLTWFTPSDYSDGEATPEKLAVRFKSHETMMEFQSSFEKAAAPRSNIGSPATGTCMSDDKADVSDIQNISQTEKEEDDDIVEIFSLAPSEIDKNKASKLLLPPCFFTGRSLWSCEKSPKGHPPKEVSNSKTPETSQNATGTFGAMANSNLPSFADIIGKSEGFGLSSATSKGFVGQGSPLFSTPDDPEHFEPTVSYSSGVNLSHVKVTTGEEGQEILFQERCKLYRFDSAEKKWKERGVGDLKILVNEHLGQCRVVMRRDHVLKVCANHCITEDINVVLKQGSENTYVWTTHGDISDGEPTSCQFGARFKTKDIAKRFDLAVQRSQHMLRTKIFRVSEKDDISLSSSEREASFEKRMTPHEPSSTAVERSHTVTPPAPVKSPSAPVQSLPAVTSLGTLASAPVERPSGFTFGTNSVSDLSFASVATSSGFSFSKGEGNSFAGAGTKLFSEREAEMSESHKETEGEEAAGNSDIRFEPIVHLEQIDVKSGEEDEDEVFVTRVKMYRFNPELKQWKERGVGTLKLLKRKTEELYRLVARRDQVGKLTANHLLVPGMVVTDFPNSSKTLMWKVGLDYSEQMAEEAMLAAKFKSEKDLKTFRNLFETICESHSITADEEGESLQANVGSEELTCSALHDKLSQHFGT